MKRLTMKLDLSHSFHKESFELYLDLWHIHSSISHFVSFLVSRHVYLLVCQSLYQFACLLVVPKKCPQNVFKERCLIIVKKGLISFWKKISNSQRSSRLSLEAWFSTYFVCHLVKNTLKILKCWQEDVMTICQVW